MTERSTSDSLGDVSWIQKATLQLCRRNVPLLHTSRYVIARDSVLPGLPPALILQETNAGVRRPGYEAIVDHGYRFHVYNFNSLLWQTIPIQLNYCIYCHKTHGNWIIWKCLR